MTKKTFLIDFIIPHFKDPRIIRTIKSIIHHKKSDLFRIIIQDGGINSRLDISIGKYLRAHDLHIKERDLGIFDALNKGLLRAKSPWVGWMGADDMLSPDFDILPILQADKGIGFISYTTLFFRDGKKVASRIFKPQSSSLLRRLGCHVPHFSTFVKTPLAKKVKFNINLKIFADQIFFYDIERVSKGVILHSCSTYMCEGGTSNKSYLQILQTNLDIYRTFKGRCNPVYSFAYVVIKIIYKLIQTLSAFFYKCEIKYPA